MVSADDTPRLRGAVVGAGQMGRFHARVITETDTTELTAIVDPEGAGERLAAMFQSSWLRSVEELLVRPPDFAIVTVPTASHGEVARSLLAAGVPTLVEKPIASTLADALATVETARAHSTPLAVGHVERFNPAVRALQAKLEAGELGRVFQIHTRRLSPFPIRVGDTGVAFDLATHDLDLMCELAGRPLRVFAESDRKAHRSHEDLLAAVLRFDSGIIGLLEVNWLTPDKVRQLTVTGEGGMFIVDYLNQHLTLYENAQATEAWETIAIFEGVTEGNVTRYAIPRVEPLRAQLEAFVSAVRGDAPVAVTGEDGLRAVKLALAAVEAGQTGAVVTLDPAS